MAIKLDDIIAALPEVGPLGVDDAMRNRASADLTGFSPFGEPPAKVESKDFDFSKG